MVEIKALLWLCYYAVVVLCLMSDPLKMMWSRCECGCRSVAIIVHSSTNQCNLQAGAQVQRNSQTTAYQVQTMYRPDKFVAFEIIINDFMGNKCWWCWICYQYGLNIIPNKWLNTSSQKRKCVLIKTNIVFPTCWIDKYKICIVVILVHVQHSKVILTVMHN